MTNRLVSHPSRNKEGFYFHFLGMSTTVVQYAPDSSIASVFHKYGFAYKLDNQNGIVVTTMNRIRIYLDIL